MSSGDMVVVGLVSDTHIIEDIGVMVPKGVAVTIPGHLCLISKDLHRGLSQRHLMLLYHPPATLPAYRASSGLGKEEREKLETENQRLVSQNEALALRNVTLESQIDSLNREVTLLKAKDMKLDTILRAIQERPLGLTPISQVVSTSPIPPTEDTVNSEVPMFIPSMIKSGNVEDRRLAVQEETSTSDVSSSANKLKNLRKGKPSQ